MKKLVWFWAIFAVVLLVGMSFQSAVVRADSGSPNPSNTGSGSSDEANDDPAVIRKLAEQLMNATTDFTDTDSDGLPDKVEMGIGTDYANPDSDFDELNDSYEVWNNLDPKKPDSNSDGLPDYFEVNNITLDLDGDGIKNAWDFDNDNDGVNDAVDLSPLSKSTVHNNFQFDIKTNGNPTYINFQLRPEDPEDLKLVTQTWDWPYDQEPPMIDLDNSKDDIEINPILELEVDTYYKISAKHSGKYLEVFMGSTFDGAKVQQYTYNGLDHQLWKLVSVGGGYYKIVAKHSGKILGVSAASRNDGADVWQETYASKANQLWMLEPVGDNDYILKAKHSGKCMEVAGASQSNGAKVQQNSYAGNDNQIWKLESYENALPEQSELLDYGVTVAINKVQIPLVPVVEYGTTVAFSGRMFYPASTPIDISAYANLYYMVTGNPDTQPVRALSNNGKYFSVKDGDTVAANSTTIDEWQKFEWVDLSNTRWDEWPIGKIALKAPNGKYLSVKSDGSVFADSEDIGEEEEFIAFYLAPLGMEKWLLKAYNNKYLAVEADGTITANSNAISAKEKMDVTHLYYKQNPISLGRYKENFMLSGFSVEENYGSDVGLFYSQDIDQVLLANIAMDYAYLRNATNDLSDMQTVFNDNDIDVTSQIETASHHHEALLKLTSEMIIDALDSLPENEVIPFITALEDSFTLMGMSELDTGSYIKGNSYDVDLTDEPLKTTRTMKTTWFNTTTGEAIDLEEIVDEITRWGESENLDQDTIGIMINLAIVWDAGESLLVKIGSMIFDFASPEYPEVFTYIGDYGIKGIDLICNSLIRLTAVFKYLVLSPTQKVGTSALRSIRTIFQGISKVSTGGVGFLNKAASALNIIGWVVTGAVALFAFISIAMDLGGNFGLFVGALYANMIIFYSVALFVIALIPYIGWAIAIAVVLSDLICGWLGYGSWSQKIMEGIVDAFTAYYTRSKVNLEMVDSTAIVDDPDNNGLNVGDRIEYISEITGKVTLTDRGSPADLDDSYITPQYDIAVPEGSTAQKGNYTNFISTTTDGTTYKSTNYEVGVWIEPDMAMVNFPFVMWLNYDYKINIDECYWAFGWHCDRDSTTGSGKTDKSTMYFDLLPGTLSEFLSWSQIGCNDYDGDGLPNSEETYLGLWRWDRDGDGLNDKFEIDSGTDPDISDSDSDGLNEKNEYLYGTNASNDDTDGDGISDYLERSGWVISFEYNGQTITALVKSDPLLNDTDFDGVEDQMEYWSNLNPRSNDTDADGVLDEASPRFEYNIEFEGKWGYKKSADVFQPYSVAVDKKNGFVYAPDEEHDCILKYYTDGRYIKKWGSYGTGNGQFKDPFGVAVDSNGYVYVSDSGNDRIQKFNSNGVYIKKWGSRGTGNGQFKAPRGITIKANNYLYVADSENSRIQVFKPSGVYYTKWGSFGNGNGQFWNPMGIASDSSGNIYVTDAALHRVQKFNAVGGYQTKWGSFGTGNGQFYGPYGIGVGKFGYVYVADTGAGRIQQFHQNGVYKSKWGTEGYRNGQLKGPSGIAFDSGGYAYVSELESNRLQKFYLNGKHIRHFYYEGLVGPLNAIRGLEIDNKGDIYFCDMGNQRIVKMDSDGKYIGSWGNYGTGNGLFKSPVGIGIYKKYNYVYVIDGENYRVQKFNSNGGYITKWGSLGSGNGQFGTLGGIDVDQNGYVYVMDTSNFRVQKFDANGNFVTKWGSMGGANGQFSYAYGIAVDKDGYVYVADLGNKRIQKFNSNGVHLKSIYSSGENQLNFPTELAVDSEGNIYVCDATNDNIMIFDPNGMPMTRWGSTGTGNDEFDNPWGIEVDEDGFIYIADEGNYNIKKFSYEEEFVPPEITDGVKDRDGDGLEDETEVDGWEISIINSSGSDTIIVTSDPFLKDTDFDGLSDYDEYNLSSNPRLPDTDSDGLTDLEEYELGTNLTCYDTDGDGLDDGTEITFGSDPTVVDTDGDGLSDYEEFILGTNPRLDDTDGDGMNDLDEVLFGSDPTSPDSDGDFLFDAQEYDHETDPNDPDNDDDGLSDGYELLYDTDPNSNDTDGDSVMDGEEVDRNMDPLSEDSDGDGLLDNSELELGTNPLNGDSDGDGVLDSEDPDSETEYKEPVIISHDPDTEVDEFLENIEEYANVTVVTPQELLTNHSDAPYIILIGRPADGEGMVGNLIYDLLEDTGDVLTNMMDSDDYRLASRHGVWTPTQTIVMLSHPYPSDLFRVLDMLRSQNVTITPDSAFVEYRAPKDFISVEEIDTLKETDSIIALSLEEAILPEVEINKYDNLTTPNLLDHSSGLEFYEIAMERYLSIDLNENTQEENEFNISAGLIEIYYTLSDCDKSGDGVLDDPNDMNESELGLYFFDETAGSWSKLTVDMDWVVEIGVNTTNVEMYGESYEGYVWAKVTKFSMFGVAGLPINRPPNVTAAKPSIEYLWSPNHKFVEITIEGVTDPDGDEIEITILNITSDEPTSSAKGAGGSNHAPDAYGVGTGTAFVRAERSGNGNGRVYTITFIARDGKGGETVGTVTVFVPLNNKNTNCIDDGQNYDATEIN